MAPTPAFILSRRRKGFCRTPVKLAGQLSHVSPTRGRYGFAAKRSSSGYGFGDGGDVPDQPDIDAKLCPSHASQVVCCALSCDSAQAVHPVPRVIFSEPHGRNLTCRFSCRFGDIHLRPYRRDAAGRLQQDRKDFEAKLTELQQRAVGSHLSKTELAHLRIGRTLGEGNFGRVLVVSRARTSARFL